MGGKASSDGSGTSGVATIKDCKDEPVLQDAVALCFSLYTNLALVQLKLPDQASEAVNTCNAALMLQPTNAKAMYLRAKALLAPEKISEFAAQEAVTTLECALKNAPD